MNEALFSRRISTLSESDAKRSAEEYYVVKSLISTLEENYLIGEHQSEKE